MPRGGLSISLLFMLDVERLCARMVCIGFDGTQVPADAAALIRRGVSTVVLFRRNVESPEQVKELCAQIKSLSPNPVTVCVDQEGGRVMRLRTPFTEVPSMRTLVST